MYSILDISVTPRYAHLKLSSNALPLQLFLIERNCVLCFVSIIRPDIGRDSIGHLSKFPVVCVCDNVYLNYDEYLLAVQCLHTYFKYIKCS
jgi:hypothetical protein